jgi:sulfatase maturation enzyme AslB (radical SAM superfamily)
MTKKFACPLPFNHMAIRPDGKIFPCCIFRWEDVPKDLDIFHPDPFNHPFMKQIRDKMSKDEHVSGCQECYKTEEMGGESFRQYANRDSETLGLHSFENRTAPELTYIDLSISNTCNNKCRMCGPQLSTQWYSDAKALGMSIPKGIVVNPFIENGDFSKLKYLKLLGGEPLLEQEKLIKILKQCDLKNLSVNLITNTTIIPNQELSNLFAQCKKVNVSLSIDSVGKLNEFLRKGSKWIQTVENIKWFQNRNYDLYVHSVASIYNVNVLDSLIDFCLQNNLPQKYVLIDGPNYMMPRNLPDSVKQKLIIKLTEQISKQDIFKIMIEELKKEGNFSLFEKHDNQINKLRNEHWKDFNPELYSLTLDAKEVIL